MASHRYVKDSENPRRPALCAGPSLDALPPRTQRFRMRLMTYSYTVSHIQGKNLRTADTISPAPLSASTITENDKELTESTNIYVDSIMVNLPGSASYLDNLRGHLAADSVGSSVMKMCQDGWTDNSSCSGPSKLSWPARAFLTYTLSHQP